MLTSYYFLTCILLSALAIWSRAKRPADYKWTKPQPVAFILAWAGLAIWPLLQAQTYPESIAWWIVAGLFLGLCGDIFLLNKKWFVPGFVGFALGHLAYIIGFASYGFELPFLWTIALLVPGIAYASLVSKLMHSNKMLPFVWIYAAVISCMLITAVNIVYMQYCHANPGSAANTGAYFLVMGAGLFCISDGFWSWNKFVKPLSQPGLCILGTYYSGQALIAFGTFRMLQIV